MQTWKRFEKIRWLLDRRQPDLTVVMDAVQKPHNVAAVIRTCDAVGIPKIHAVIPDAPMEFRNRASSGAYKWVKTVRHKQITDAYAVLRSQGFTVLVAHHAAEAKDYRAIDYTRPIAIVVGTEKDGLSAEAIEQADGSIMIPMTGMVESLNVSVATALILFEAQRQRQIAGYYDACRLDGETYTRLLFEFAHPRIAAYCRRHGLPYPKLNAQGELIEPLPTPPRTDVQPA